MPSMRQEISRAPQREDECAKDPSWLEDDDAKERVFELCSSLWSSRRKSPVPDIVVPKCLEMNEIWRGMKEVVVVCFID